MLGEAVRITGFIIRGVGGADQRHTGQCGLDLPGQCRGDQFAGTAQFAHLPGGQGKFSREQERCRSDQVDAFPVGRADGVSDVGLAAFAQRADRHLGVHLGLGQVHRVPRRQVHHRVGAEGRHDLAQPVGVQLSVQLKRVGGGVGGGLR